MTKILIMQPVLAHYRESVFKSFLNLECSEVIFLSGREYLNIKSLNIDNTILCSHMKIRLFKHDFYYLKGSLKAIHQVKPDIIVSSGVDPHLVHTLFAFLYFRMIKKTKFYWWSHAGTGNQGKLGRLFRHFIYKNASGILTYSSQGKKNLLNWRISEKKIQTIGNAINLNDYGYMNYKSLLPKPNEKFEIVFVGRINEGKRVDILIQAISILRKKHNVNVHVKIIGNGDLGKLLQLVSEERLELQVTLMGPLYGEDVAKHLMTAHLMVFPRYIGLSLLHAFSFGIPVITSGNLQKQGPEIELMIPGKTGDYYMEDDCVDLADKIFSWKLKIDKEGETISRDCIARIEEMEYLPQIVAKKIINFIGK